MHLLTLLTPFILGLAIQAGVIASALLAAPTDNHQTATKISRDDFAYRLDVATFLPSFLTLLSAALLNRGSMPEEVVTLILVGAILLFAALGVTLYRCDQTTYADTTNRMRGLTPLNAWIIGANMLLALLTLGVFLTGGGASEKESEGAGHRESRAHVLGSAAVVAENPTNAGRTCEQMCDWSGQLRPEL